MSSKKLNRMIKAECVESAKIEAAKDENGLPTFSILAYTGDVMNVSGWYLPVVIDLAGLALGKKLKPILKDHDSTKIIGHTEETIKGETSLTVNGVISAVNEYSREVLESGLNGFPWQASVGVEVNKVVEIPEGKTVTVNGREFSGNIYVARKSVLKEVSFVTFGADENTSASVAAEAVFDVEVLGDKEMDEEKIEAAKPELKTVEAAKAVEKEEIKIDPVAEIRAESKRIREINAACKDYPEIAEKAVADGLSVAEAKAAMFDAIEARQGSEISASYVNFGGEKADSKALEAAAIMASGAVRSGKLEDHYSEKTLDAAHKLRNVGLRDMIKICCANEGKRIEAGASIPVLASTGFSTVSLPNLLSNLATKALMDEYMSRNSVAAMISEKLSTNDFKEQTGIRLGGLGMMEEVQNGGALTHGTMTEETFNYRVNTVGKIIGLTREMIQNDDLGGFVRIARNLGRSAFNTREYDFWKLVIDNASSFFSVAHGNLITDALDIDAIALAETALVEQTGIDGTPINIEGNWLVVPPQLHAIAKALYTSDKVISANSKEPDANIYQGMYEPMMTPYLSNSSVSDNYSSTGWYLWSKTNKPYGIAYLNGVETPTIEEVDPGAEYLGRAWRAYFDYGICEIDYRGAVHSTGAGS